MDAYNGGRLRAACQLMRDKYSAGRCHHRPEPGRRPDPGGLGPSTVIPLMNHGFVDWIVATGANMYHDMHFAFNLPMHRGSHSVDDADLRDKGRHPDLRHPLRLRRRAHGNGPHPAEDHAPARIPEGDGDQGILPPHGEGPGRVREEERPGRGQHPRRRVPNGIPVFTSSPGDSTIGMNVAGLELLAEAAGLQDLFKLKINPSIDVNDSTAIILNAKRYEKGKTGGHPDRRREPEELHAPDRAADPGSADDPGGRPGLRHQHHRRAARYRRAVRRAPQRGGELGQDRPDHAGPDRDRVHRRDRGLSPAGGLHPADDASPRGRSGSTSGATSCTES